jgi:hypothetical protein
MPLGVPEVLLGVPEVLRRRMAAALLPYTANTSVAVATELGIHAEAAVRALAGAVSGVSGPPGSPVGDLGDREVSERHLRIVGEGGLRSGAGTRARRPAVHGTMAGAGPRRYCSTDGARAAWSGPSLG